MEFRKVDNKQSIFKFNQFNQAKKVANLSNDSYNKVKITLNNSNSLLLHSLHKSKPLLLNRPLPDVSYMENKFTSLQQKSIKEKVINQFDLIKKNVKYKKKIENISKSNKVKLLNYQKAFFFTNINKQKIKKLNEIIEDNNQEVKSKFNFHSNNISSNNISFSINDTKDNRKKFSLNITSFDIHRNNYIKELNKKISVNTVKRDKGSVNNIELKGITINHIDYKQQIIKNALIKERPKSKYIKVICNDLYDKGNENFVKQRNCHSAFIKRQVI